MRGWRLVVPFLVLVLGAYLMSSCGMVNDTRRESTGVADMTEREPRHQAEPGSGPAGVFGPSTTTTVAAAVAPTTTAPPFSQRTDLPPDDLAAIDRCMRVASFQAAGFAVYQTTLGRDVVSVDTLGELVYSMKALGSAVSPAGNEALQSVLGILEPEVAQIVTRPEVSVVDLQALVERIAPHLTELLRDLMRACPQAIGPDDVTDVERIQLGVGGL